MINKFLITLVFVGILAPLASFFGPSAFAVDAGGSPVVNFATLQQSIIKVIDAAVAKLDGAEAKISSNTAIAGSTKQAALDGLNKTETALLNYKTKVQAATSVAELQALNKQIIQYIKDNKDVIRANIQLVITNIATQVSAKVAELEELIANVLTALKITCPSEIATINELESQLQQLKTESAKLQAAIKAKDTVAMKKEISEITALVQTILPNLQKLEAACLQGALPTP